MLEASSLRPGDPSGLGGYSLVGRLGEGGQGVVFLGHGPAGEQVAIKLLRAQLDRDSTAYARFVREVSIAGRVAPFCTARVISADLFGETPYIVSEYVAGPSLLEAVRGNGPLTGAGLDRLAVGTATALAAVHEAGIVHRDFKPGNVLLAADGPRVIDFGIARALDATSTITSRVIGTPAFMSPEQVNDEQVEPPSDMFAWGATIVYAATGASPFDAGTIPAVLNRIMNHEPDLTTLTGPLHQVVTAALSKDPRKRPTPRQILDHMVSSTAGTIPPRRPDPATPPAAAPPASASPPAPASTPPAQTATAKLPPTPDTTQIRAPTPSAPAAPPTSPGWGLIGPVLGGLVGLYLLGVMTVPGWRLDVAGAELGGSAPAMVGVSAGCLVAAMLTAPVGAVLGRRSPNAVAAAAAGLMLLGLVADVLAPDLVLLVVGRILASLGAGALIAEMVVLTRRANRQWAYTIGGLGVLAFVLGAVPGGWLASALAWRWALLIALPPLILALLISVIEGIGSIARRPANHRG